MSDEKKKRPGREKMPSHDPKKRIKNFNEVNFGYTPEKAIKEAKRCIQCKNPKCNPGCPVNIKIPDFIDLIAKGEFVAAARKIKEDNALPAICGRVCPQEEQCEIVCVLGVKGEPIAIGHLERFAADYEREKNHVEIPKVAKPTGKRVAVVGSGPASLTVVGDLVQLGHEVTIFEGLHKPGGVLVYGIPEFRLPKAIVKAEIDYLKKMGVKIECNSIIGKLKSVDELLENGFDAVFIGTGAGLPYFMEIPGKNLNGVYSANEYLTRSNLMKAYLFPEYDTPIIRGKNVAVIGGGNTALDAVRTAIRLGADNGYIVYRRSKKEMPARDEEIMHAEEEGVQFHFLCNPVRIIGNKDGWVKAIECLRMELGEPDESGRRRPVPIEGSEFQLKVDTVVFAIGTGANPIIPKTTPDIKTSKWGTILVNEETGETSKKGVFAGGDIVTGGATVILAMGAGRRASAAIDKYLRDENKD
ncbi:MAG TPA: NADPH-dependent glutamate synthase [Nitrospinota bacterium]|nr:NADPH-dependent glutamate synthase [Nitrospinota bacterium]